jgi:hypothetical protein
MASKNFDEVFEDYAETTVETVLEVVVDETPEAPTRVTTLSLPEWQAALAGLIEAGYDVDGDSSFPDVRAALTEFQLSAGIRGMDEGIPTPVTLELLGA